MSSLPYRLLFYAALAGVLLLHLSSHLELVLHRTGPTLTSTPSYVLPSGEILAIASANHRTAASDLVWINAILFTADLYRSRRHTGQITDFADAIVYLDGHFYPVYRWHRSSRIHLNRHVTREDIEEAIRVNERGLEYFPDSWELPQGIALTLIGGRLERTQEERIADLERVVFYATLAADQLDAPEQVFRLATAYQRRLLQEKGSDEEIHVSQEEIDFLLRRYYREQNREAQDFILDRLVALGAGDDLARQSRIYTEQFEDAHRLMAPFVPPDLFSLSTVEVFEYGATLDQ